MLHPLDHLGHGRAGDLEPLGDAGLDDVDVVLLELEDRLAVLLERGVVLGGPVLGHGRKCRAATCGAAGVIGTVGSVHGGGPIRSSSAPCSSAARPRGLRLATRRATAPSDCTKIVGGKVTLVARNLQWNTDCLRGAAGEDVAFTVKLEDEGVKHDLEVFGQGIERAKTPLEAGRPPRRLDVRLPQPGPLPVRLHDPRADGGRAVRRAAG